MQRMVLESCSDPALSCESRLLSVHGYPFFSRQYSSNTGTNFLGGCYQSCCLLHHHSPLPMEVHADKNGWTDKGFKRWISFLPERGNAALWLTLPALLWIRPISHTQYILCSQISQVLLLEAEPEAHFPPSLCVEGEWSHQCYYCPYKVIRTDLLPPFCISALETDSIKKKKSPGPTRKFVMRHEWADGLISRDLEFQK